MPKANTLKTKNNTVAKKAPKNIAVENTITTPRFPLSKDQITSFMENYRSILNNRRTYLIVLVLGLLLLAYYKKGWFVAATVNGSPITNFELISHMNKQFRDQTLTQMVNEKIMLQEARNNQIVVTQTDIDQKISELEKNVGGPQVLDNLLTQQGQTRDTIKDQIKYMIIRDKLFEKDATVSAEEVQKFIDQNKDQLRATESAEQTKEATDILKQQKIGQLFNEKFTQIRKDAKVNIF